MPPMRGTVPYHAFPTDQNPYTPEEQDEIRSQFQELYTALARFITNPKCLDVPPNIATATVRVLFVWLKARVNMLFSILNNFREILRLRNICTAKEEDPNDPDATVYKPFCADYDWIQRGVEEIRDYYLLIQVTTHDEALKLASACFVRLLHYLRHLYDHHVKGDDHDYYYTQGQVQRSLDVFWDLQMVFGRFYKLAYEMGLLRQTDIQQLNDMAHVCFAAAGIQPPGPAMPIGFALAGH